MLEKLLTLMEAIRNVPDRVGDVGSCLEVPPDREAFPDPQVSWTLMGLVHYRQRKLWAWRVLRERLSAQLSRPRKAWVTLKDVLEGVQTGIVPGLPDWEYHLDGNDSHLIHRGTGEDIHIDALNGPELIPEEWFIQNFHAHRAPGPAEQRLRRLFPHRAGCLFALDMLRKTCLLHPSDEENEFELCGKVTAYADDMAAFLSRWGQADAPEQRVWLAAWIGDWLAAHEAATVSGNTRLIALTASRAEVSRVRWLKRLRKWLARRGLDGGLLLALADAGDDELPRHLTDALSGGAAAFAALDVVADDPSWCPKVYDLLTGAARVWDSDTSEKATRYLARHSHRVAEVIDRLRRRKKPSWNLLIELAMKVQHEKLGSFVRNGLRSRDHEDRLTAAAVLAFIDEGWSREELLSVLNQSNDPERMLEVREALRLSRDAEAVQTLERWEAAHPEREPTSPLRSARMYYTMMYGATYSCKQRLLDRMQELSEELSRTSKT